MKLLIERLGNGLAVRLPNHLLARLNASLGDRIEVEVAPGGVLLRRSAAIYSLPELIAQCDLDAPPPTDLMSWSHTKPVGREFG